MQNEKKRKVKRERDALNIEQGTVEQGMKK